MAAMAAMKSGCGLVKIIAPLSISHILNILIKESIVIPVPEQNGVIHPDLTPDAVEVLKTANSVLVGCGLGKGEHHKLIKNILVHSGCGVIIDADGINSLAGNLDIIKNKNILLTPHPKEFSRISGYSVADIEKSRMDCAEAFVKEHGVQLLLKGARTIITYGGSNKYISIEATSALAKAGSGDVLAGIIVSLAAQGITLTDSAVAACLIHTTAGLIAEKEVGAYGTTADDLIKLVPSSIQHIQN
jgi:NAD(P)H-hydrate epimerase